MQTKLLTREEAAAKIVAIKDPEERAQAAELALKLYGEAPQSAKFAPFQFEPQNYIEKFLRWQPWNGTSSNPGQIQVIEAYVLALRQQFERRDFELGILKKSDLKYWQPGQVIQNYLRIEAGHTTGKTKLESGLVNHFLDCFAPSTVMMYGPGHDSLKDNLWQELEVDRKFNDDLPGRMLDSMEIRIGPNHFAKARVASDAHGKGSERIQGKHGEFLMFVLDEAEGIANFVFNAIDSMTSGGISIVLMVANPKTRTSKFHKLKGISNVKSFRMSCLSHPNVIAGAELVPGAVRRHYVEMMVEKHCDVVPKHDEEKLTFDLPYPIHTATGTLPPLTVFEPKPEFMFRVLGIAPPNVSDKNVIPLGIYEAAKKRVPVFDPENFRSTFGVDVARFGGDNGTLYARDGAVITKEAEFVKQDTDAYWEIIKKKALARSAKGITHLHVRIDGTGGFGSGLIDKLKKDDELIKAFREFKVFEVHFGASAHDPKKYYNLVTEMYFETRETLKGVSVVNPPDALEVDLTERQYDYRNVSGVTVKILEDKETFKKHSGEKRSPDDGDGFVLAAAPDYCFADYIQAVAPISVGQINVWNVK